MNPRWRFVKRLYRIQELEREREEIINSIELQITGALDHYMPQLPPSCSSSRPGTPGDALVSPTTGNSVLLSRPVSEDAGRKSKKRPIIADSQQSLKSADTTSADTTRRVEQAVEWIVDDSSFASGD